MFRNALGSAFILPCSTAALVIGFVSHLEAAPAVPRSMSEVMHLDHASKLPVTPLSGATVIPKDFRFATSPALTAGTAASCEHLDGEPDIASDPAPAPASPRSMSEVMHLDHASGLAIQPAGAPPDSHAEISLIGI